MFYKPNATPPLPPNEFVFPKRCKVVVNGLDALLYKEGGNVTEADAKMTVDANYVTTCVSLVPERPNLLNAFMKGHADAAVRWAVRFAIPPAAMWMKYFTELRKRGNRQEARRNARKGIRD